MLASEWYVVLTLLGIAVAAICAVAFGFSWGKSTKSQSETIPGRGLSRHVRFDYRSTKGASANLHAIIYEVEERRGRLYFNGLCLPGRAPRTFRSDRVEHLVDVKTGEIPTDMDAWLRKLAAGA